MRKRQGKSRKNTMAEAAATRAMSEDRARLERQLALEIRSGKFGYAVIEGNTLLDWGVCEYHLSELDHAMSRIAFLLRLYGPLTVVTRTTRRAASRSSKNAAKALRRMRDKATRSAIRFVVVARRNIQDFFRERGCRNKHEIAGMVAERFSQLKRRVPKPRKAWEPESATTAIFDALATLMAAEEIQTAR